MTTHDEAEQFVRQSVARLRSSVMAVVFGLVGGLGIFLATLWLVIRGGVDIGAHLGLLRNYLPGYSVTWGGSLVGLIYGCLLGAAIGWSVAWIYNRVALR